MSLPDTSAPKKVDIQHLCQHILHQPNLGRLKQSLIGIIRNPNHRLVVISNEIISWKVEMMMNLINEVLPEYGKATVLIGVTQRFPKTEHFYRYFQPGTWSDAMVVGSSPQDEEFAKELNVDFFTQDQLNYDI